MRVKYTLHFFFKLYLKFETVFKIYKEYAKLKKKAFQVQNSISNTKKYCEYKKKHYIKYNNF